MDLAISFTVCVSPLVIKKNLDWINPQIAVALNLLSCKALIYHVVLLPGPSMLSSFLFTKHIKNS